MRQPKTVPKIEGACYTNANIAPLNNVMQTMTGNKWGCGLGLSPEDPGPIHFSCDVFGIEYMSILVSMGCLYCRLCGNIKLNLLSYSNLMSVTQYKNIMNIKQSKKFCSTFIYLAAAV